MSTSRIRGEPRIPIQRSFSASPRPSSRRRRGRTVDTEAKARDLVAGLMSMPLGQIAPSVYETGRLITLAPWLSGGLRRLEFLLSRQGTDGGWGPNGYALVQTLSATEALLTTLRRIEETPRRDDIATVGHARLVDAASRGMRRLFSWLRTPKDLSIPDTPAVELIVPSLVDAINVHLDLLRDSPIAGLDAWRISGRLSLPVGVDHDPLTALRLRLRSGLRIPDKMLHTLEAAGDAARGASVVRPVSPGTVGASPAATAAWLGDLPPNASNPARLYLEALVAESGGPVPCCVPVNVFERAWVLRGLRQAGMGDHAPPWLVESLDAAFGESGAPSGAGLPPDADTTSVALFALAQQGVYRDVTCLATYDLETHFCTWPGEQGISTTVNAHALEAMGDYVNRRLDAFDDASDRHVATVAKLSDWLQKQQCGDGSWLDRWHVSAYYATLCCALALERYGDANARQAIGRALRWILATQREDGSWGIWHGTVEETAYALQTLLLAQGVSQDGVEAAAARGYLYIVWSMDRQDQPALWVGKDLYLPTAVVRSAALEAIHIAQQRPGVVALATKMTMRWQRGERLTIESASRHR